MSRAFLLFPSRRAPILSRGYIKLQSTVPAAAPALRGNRQARAPHPPSSHVQVGRTGKGAFWKLGGAALSANESARSWPCRYPPILGFPIIRRQAKSIRASPTEGCTQSIRNRGTAPVGGKTKMLFAWSYIANGCLPVRDPITAEREVLGARLET